MEISRAGSRQGLSGALSKRKKEEQAQGEQKDASADLYPCSKLLAAHTATSVKAFCLDRRFLKRES